MFLVLIPILVPYCMSLGLSMQQFFQLQATFGIAVVICEVPTGYLCDLWGRKRTLCIGSFIAAVGYTYLCFAKTYAGLMTYEIVVGIGVSLVSGADVSFIYDSLQSEERVVSTRALANLQFAQTFSEALASILAGFLVVYSFQHVLWANALTSWIPFFIALTFKEPKYKKMQGNSHLENFKRVFSHILHSDRMLRLIFINLVTWGAATFFAVWIFQKYWHDRGFALTNFGLFWAAYLVTAGLVGKRVHYLEKRWGPRVLLVAIGVLPVLGYLGMAFSLGWMGVALGFLFYISRGISQVLLRDAFNWRLPGEFRATANSIQSFCFRLGFGVFGPLVGYIIDHRGVDRALEALGAGFAILFVLTLVPLIRELGNQTIPDAE